MRYKKTTRKEKDRRFILELDKTYRALEKGIDKGFTLEQLDASIDKLRKKRYGYLAK